MLNDHYLASISTNLANDLVILRFNKNHKLITHNTKDLCIYIPIEETILTYLLHGAESFLRS